MVANDRMIFLRILFVFLLLGQSASSQSRLYFIGFTDRNNSPFTLQQPLQFLSQQAIDRRAAHNIPVEESDMPVNPQYVDSLVAHGAAVLNPVKWMNGAIVLCDSNVLSSILTLPFVRQHQVVRRTGGPRRIHNKFEPSFPAQKSSLVSARVTFDYGEALRQIDQINGDFLHQSGFTGQDMRIAVLDAGFNSADLQSAFDSMFSAGRLIGTWDFVDRQPSVFEDDAHGTSVLSCMAALQPGVMVGTAPHAEYLLLRSEDANTEYLVEEYNWAVAAAYADSAGCDIISSSLGYFYFDDGAMDHSYADMDGNSTPISRAADIAASKGMLVLSSAGNTGNSSWHYIVAPADADSILAVGAVDSLGFKAGFSAWGPSVDGRIKPDVAAMGARTFVGIYDGSFGRSNGTSFSCPVLAGAAACLWQAHPDKSNMDILQAIQRSANYYNTPGDSLGYGVPDFQSAHLQLGGTVLDLPAEDGLVGLYPVPASDYLTISFYSSIPQRVSITILDLEGRMVTQDDYDATAAFINSWKIGWGKSIGSGTYVVKVVGEKQVFSKKFVIAR